MDPHHIKVLQEKQYKGWPKCVWVKCIKGIGAHKEVQAKKSVFESGCSPDLKEDHLKVTVLKQNPNYPVLFHVFDFRVTPHSLQEAANVHKVTSADVVHFLEALCSKPMGSDEYQFFSEHGIEVVADDIGSVRGEYKYIENTTIPHLALELQSSTRLRNHQLEALAAVFPPTRVPRVALSGVLEMPCGSGKTLTGIAIACKIQKSTLVLCNNSNAVDHWRSEFLRFSNISERGITRATGEIKDELFKTSGVLITTYPMLAVKEGKSKHSKYLVDTVKSRIWGCVLFDEVHHLPASGISSVAGNLRGKCKIGLTGTLNREDSKITHLDDLVGPCLYRTNLQMLRDQQLVANIVMKQVMCEMSPEFMKIYNCVRGKSAHRVRSILSVLSPHKFHTVLSLITKHERQGDKILVFVDNKFEIQEYSKRLSRPFISGDTDKQPRESLFKDFVGGNTVNTILITRTGDESLNLPVANVVIQTSFHHGANNQEMQRLGRILRPKGGAAQGEIEGVFYSLVSKGTREMIYAKRRRKLVTADGVDYLEEELAVDATVHFPTAEEQAQLIKEVLRFYDTSAYLDLDAPSDHAKKVQQELAKQAKSKSKAKAAKEESKEEGDNEEEDDEDDDNEESESEESGGEEADGKAKTSGKQQVNKVATGKSGAANGSRAASASGGSSGNGTEAAHEVSGVASKAAGERTTKEGEPITKDGEPSTKDGEPIITTATTTARSSNGSTTTASTDGHGRDAVETEAEEDHITGKKRTEPEPDIVTTSTYRAKRQAPPPSKKAFQPNIVPRKR